MNFSLRPIYRLSRLFSQLRHGVTRRFTRPGQVVLVAALGAGLVGFDTDNTVAYQAFTLLLGLLGVSVLGGGFFKLRFAAERALPRFGTVGQPFHYRVTVRNLTDKPQAGLTLLERVAEPPLSFAEWQALRREEERRHRPFRLSALRRPNPVQVATVKPTSVPSLPPRQTGEVQVELTPLRRGVLDFEGVTLARPDPLGLFRALATVAVPQTLLILPKRYALPPVALPGTTQYQPGGVALATEVGQSEEFVALRDYRRGDPLRHIHWRSWAKVGKPIVKEFEDEFFVRHALVLDTFTDRPYSDVFEEAVAVAASFACTVLTQESLLDLLFVGPRAFCFTAGRGLAHVDQILEILAAVRPCPDQPFRALEHLVLSHVGVVSGCVCILLAWDDARRDFVQKLKMLGLPLRVCVLRPPGQRHPLDPGPMHDAPHHLHALEVGQIEEQLATLK